MALTIEYDTLDDVTVGATELSIISGTTTLQTVTVDGVYQLFVDDRSNMTKTEEYAIRIYETVLAADASKRQIFKATIKGVQSEPFVSPFLMLGNGWDMTLQKIAGTDRAFSARISQMT
jgi:hypothetical protein